MGRVGFPISGLGSHAMQGPCHRRCAFRGCLDIIRWLSYRRKGRRANVQVGLSAPHVRAEPCQKLRHPGTRRAQPPKGYLHVN